MKGMPDKIKGMTFMAIESFDTFGPESLQFYETIRYSTLVGRVPRLESWAG